ncbi:MAG: hypothetical protein L3K17_04455 [Thermoplasmata archaeon]|nr:hypothetical protein [Thermoplasmata archaeon]
MTQMMESQMGGRDSNLPRSGIALERLAIGMFVLLAIEFILGMTLGLLLSIPSGVGAARLLETSPVLDLHILLALAIIGISLRALVAAASLPERAPIMACAVALGSAIVATLAGSAFAFDGQSPTASFVMAMGFLGVLFAAFVLRGSGRRGLPEGPTPRSRGDTVK